MSRTFKVESKNFMEKPTIYVTLYNPPYDKETILARTNWKVSDVIITEERTRGIDNDDD